MSRRLKNVDTIMEMMAGNAVGQVPTGFNGKADAAGPVAGYDKPFSRKSMQLVGVGREKFELDHLKIVDQNLNTAIIERLERVVDTLQENSIQMGEFLLLYIMRSWTSKIG